MSATRRLQNFVTPTPLNLTIVSKQSAEAGDILLTDKSGNLSIARFSIDPIIDMDLYTPIGVVVIPTLHDVYGTGECAVMSLVRMDVSSENGSIDPSSSCFWGGVGHDIEGLQNYTQAFCVANMSANFGTSQVAQNSRDLTGMVPMLPSDIYDTNIKNPYAPDGMNSYGPNSNIAYLGPSPYLSDMKFNALVKNTNPSSSCYSDFDGKGNTEKMLQDDYVHQIVNASSIFRTEGTNPGDWYVPSAGEILYLVARYKKIMETMVSLKTSGYRCLPIYINQTFHTSTEYNADYMVHLYIYDTFCEISASWGKSSKLETRGFIRV